MVLLWHYGITFVVDAFEKDDPWRKTAMTREKRPKKHRGDASVKQHDAMTRDEPKKYDAWLALGHFWDCGKCRSFQNDLQYVHCWKLIYSVCCCCKCIRVGLQYVSLLQIDLYSTVYMLQLQINLQYVSLLQINLQYCIVRYTRNLSSQPFSKLVDHPFRSFTRS